MRRGVFNFSRRFAAPTQWACRLELSQRGEKIIHALFGHRYWPKERAAIRCVYLGKRLPRRFQGVYCAMIRFFENITPHQYLRACSSSPTVRLIHTHRMTDVGLAVRPVYLRVQPVLLANHLAIRLERQSLQCIAPAPARIHRCEVSRLGRPLRRGSASNNGGRSAKTFFDRRMSMAQKVKTLGSIFGLPDRASSISGLVGAGVRSRRRARLRLALRISACGSALRVPPLSPASAFELLTRSTLTRCALRHSPLLSMGIKIYPSDPPGRPQCREQQLKIRLSRH